MKSCGRFEKLVCQDNSRTKLQVVKYGSRSTDELWCLGTEEIYICPIQGDIFLEIAHQGISALQGFHAIATDASLHGRVYGIPGCSPADIFSFISVKKREILGKIYIYFKIFMTWKAKTDTNTFLLNG